MKDEAQPTRDDYSKIWPVLDEKYKYIARDEDGEVYAFQDRPFSNDVDCWRLRDFNKMVCLDHLVFPRGTEDWENSLQERPNA